MSDVRKLVMDLRHGNGVLVQSRAREAADTLETLIEELEAARAVVDAANGILRGDLNGYAKLGSVLDAYDRVRGADA